MNEKQAERLIELLGRVVAQLERNNPMQYVHTLPPTSAPNWQYNYTTNVGYGEEGNTSCGGYTRSSMGNACR